MFLLRNIYRIGQAFLPALRGESVQTSGIPVDPTTEIDERKIITGLGICVHRATHGKDPQR
jgi:hypothetical protein